MTKDPSESLRVSPLPLLPMLVLLAAVYLQLPWLLTLAIILLWLVVAFGLLLLLLALIPAWRPSFRASTRMMARLGKLNPVASLSYGCCGGILLETHPLLVCALALVVLLPFLIPLALRVHLNP